MQDEQYSHELVDVQDNFQPPMPYSMGASQNTGHSDLVKLSLVTNDVLDEIRIRLGGLEFNQDRQRYEPSPFARPLLADIGVAGIVTILASYINRNTTLSNLTDEEIKLIAKEAEQITNDALHDHYTDKDWGVKKENWAIIRSIVGNQIRFALTRAKNGNEMQILGGNTKTVKSIQQSEGTQRIIDGSKKWGLFK